MPNDAATTKRTAHEPATARWSQLDISDPAALPEDVRWIPAENKHSERTAAYALAEVFEFAWSSGYLIGDFDGDGACDHLISEGQTLKLSPLELESLGSVLPAATSTPVRPMPMHEVFNSDDPEEIRHRLMYAYRIVSADLDSDGVQALIFAQPGFDSFGDPAFGERGRLHRWTRTGNGYASSDILEGPVSFASILAGPLDFDGDGHSDLAVSAPEERRVFVIRGGVDQPWTTLDAGLRANAIIELDVTKLGPLPGWSLAAVGDLDANGRDELLVSGANGAFVYAGSTSTRPSPAMSIVGDAGDGLFGIGGDFNGDGRADLAIGETLRGRVSIVYGATPMPTGSINLSLPSAGVPPIPARQRSPRARPNWRSRRRSARRPVGRRPRRIRADLRPALDHPQPRRQTRRRS